MGQGLVVWSLSLPTNNTAADTATDANSDTTTAAAAARPAPTLWGVGWGCFGFFSCLLWGCFEVFLAV